MSWFHSGQRAGSSHSRHTAAGGAATVASASTDQVAMAPGTLTLPSVRPAIVLVGSLHSADSPV